MRPARRRRQLSAVLLLTHCGIQAPVQSRLFARIQLATLFLGADLMICLRALL
jgi:hypothetical protein